MRKFSEDYLPLPPKTHERALPWLCRFQAGMVGW